MLRRLAYAPQASLKSRNHDAPDFLHILETPYISGISSASYSQVVN